VGTISGCDPSQPLFASDGLKSSQNAPFQRPATAAGMKSANGLLYATFTHQTGTVEIKTTAPAAPHRLLECYRARRLSCGGSPDVRSGATSGSDQLHPTYCRLKDVLALPAGVPFSFPSRTKRFLGLPGSKALAARSDVIRVGGASSVQWEVIPSRRQPAWSFVPERPCSQRTRVHCPNDRGVE
jgi:hypothetical protein